MGWYIGLFDSLSLAAKIYLYIRILLIPSDFFVFLTTHITQKDRVVDIGCGYGMLSFFAHTYCHASYVFGVDFDVQRIKDLQQLVDRRRISGIHFETRDLMKEWFDGFEKCNVAMISDVLHHIDTDTQNDLLRFLSEQEVNTLIIKDIDRKPYWKYCWNYFHDRVIMRNDVLSFQGSEKIKSILVWLGYTVKEFPVRSIFPYPHYLFYATK